LSKTIWSAFITVLKDVQLQIHGFIFKENSVYPYIISPLASPAKVAKVKKIVFYTPFVLINVKLLPRFIP
jgi:histidinol dehydrogenase